MNLEQLAQALGAQLQPAALSTSAPDNIEITGVAGLEDAGPADVSFVANPRYRSAAQTTRAAAVLVEPDFPPLPMPTLRVANPYLAFARAIDLFHKAPLYPPGIHPTAVIDPTAVLGSDVHVGPYAVIGAEARIGEGSVLLAHAVIYAGATTGARFFAHAHAIVREGCILGDDVTLGNGVVVGSDGFGFARDGQRGWRKILQSGHVVIGDSVEIQANSCIDRASIGKTTIANGAKLDNLVQVGHGATVGAHTLLCSQVGLAGSSRIGSNVILAGQVGVAGHLTVGDGAIATAQSGIPGDVEPGQTVSGYPAIVNRHWLRASAVFTRLPDMLRRLQKLEARLSKVTGEQAAGEAADTSRQE